jgi:hypothetical protein
MADSTRIHIDGDTYPVKEQLKAIGCRWDQDRRAWYAETAEVAEKARAIVQPRPLYNSPPPQDLGTVDPETLAAKFGRTPVEGAKVQSFTGHGKDPEPDGSIIRSKGKSYVQVAAGRPRYYSRDMLEDFDMFGDEPGYQYQRDVVEVELSDDERVADTAKMDAKTARERAAAVLKAAADRVRKEGERPAQGEAKVPTGPGTETIAADRAGVYSGPRQHFEIGDGWIWFTQYNGSDGDDWSCNNLSGSIGWRIAFDADLVTEIRAAAKLLGFERKVEKGPPPRTEIRTEHGRVYKSGYREDSSVLIDWTSTEPLLGITEFTCGVSATLDGTAVVQFREEAKKNGKRHRLSPRIEGRHDLLELVNLAAELKAELKAHYRQED